MKLRVTVTLKSGVLDPQGRAIHHAIANMGHGGVSDVRVGKIFEIEAPEGLGDAALEEIAGKLLANGVIETYRIEKL